MPVGAPTLASPLPPELLDLARQLLARLPELASELAALLSEKEEFYRRVNVTAPDELRKVCEVNLRNAFTAFIEGRDASVEAVRKTGLAQAKQGIPLSAVLRAFRIAGTFTYETLMERAIPPGIITPEQLLPVSTTVWRIIDSYSAVITAAYSEFEAHSARYDEKARLGLIDGLLDGRFTKQAELDDAAKALNLPQAGTFVVVFSDRTPGAERSAALVDPRRWRMVWRSLPEAEIGIVAVERATDLRALREALDSSGHGIGMSPPVSGLRRIPAALRRARIARRCLAAGETGVVGFGDQPLTTLVAGSRELARELAREVLSGVLELPKAEQDVLLKTLHAWYAEGGSAKSTAARLFVHPNTVRYRIRRIQELTKRDLADPRSIAELYASVETARLDPTLGAAADA
ncbi:DNA-binding transcriptional regulator, PucR family [Actinokineospora alba]|uniref:DNA-binding transcriptional regulator, PucR family n=1 Tax=Actinokineospora alba TaxID=504798 RepID=A0A1H0S6U8_9PSEU|nr:DNA-binding PucR family transcriptional regulator [Actinokineospora alba]SDI50699.1 DNA-binding transcriptional regulator, PucR family [Actinokineospora alba]SDP37492.1 DNA-binding transcriptional regulator, PucR family [Actinokineospora alba]